MMMLLLLLRPGKRTQETCTSHLPARSDCANFVQEPKRQSRVSLSRQWLKKNIQALCRLNQKSQIITEEPILKVQCISVKLVDGNLTSTAPTVRRVHSVFPSGQLGLYGALAYTLQLNKKKFAVHKERIQNNMDKNLCIYVTGVPH